MEMIVKQSVHGVSDTVDRLEAALANRGIAIAARIDHAAAAKVVGEELRPTQVLIFGNPRLGSLLMQRDQTIALDLPLKVLVWQDEQGAVWTGYMPVQDLAARYTVADAGAVVATMSALLDSLINIATGASS